MRCPTLDQLPPPPASREGWPWTQSSPELPDIMADGRPWPKVVIITPSYNQGQFLEETIRSVLLQGYPDLEYLIIDGGSRDNSVEVIKKYEPWLTYWVSERDSGQAHAIQKGWDRSAGEVTAWLNSDDVYLPGALAVGARGLRTHRDAALVYGHAEVFEEETGRLLHMNNAAPTDFEGLVFHGPICQPAVFMRREHLDAVGKLDMSLRYAFDYDLWLRMAERWAMVPVDASVVRYRLWSQSKTVAEWHGFYPEFVQVISRAIEVSNHHGHQPRLQAWLHVRRAILAYTNGDGSAAAEELEAARCMYPRLLSDKEFESDMFEWVPHEEQDLEAERAFLLSASSAIGLNLRTGIAGQRMGDISFLRALDAARQGRRLDTLNELAWAIFYHSPLLANRGLWSLMARAIAPTPARYLLGELE